MDQSEINERLGTVKMTIELPGASLEGATPPASRDAARNLGPGCDGLNTTARPGRFCWTSENTRRLIELAETKTIPEIAAIMGTSKNSIVGRAHRLGISFPAFRFECARNHRKIASMMAAGLGVTDIARALGQPISTVGGKIRYLRRREEAMKIPLTLDNIGPDQCRWPLGDMKERATEFCGEPVVAGKSYCAPHHARAHIKPLKDKGQPFHFERKRP